MEDLTISELVSDPLIGLLLKADKIAPAAFAQLLESAARVRRNAACMKEATISMAERFQNPLASDYMLAGR